MLGVIAVSASCHLLALLYVVFVMEKKETVGEIGPKDIFNFKSFFDGVSVVFRKRKNGHRRIIITVIVVAFLCEFTMGARVG